MLNYEELKDNVGVMCQRSADASYLTNIGIWVNLAQDYLFESYDYFPELQDRHNFETVDGTEDYYMPSRFDKPLRVYDIENDTKLSIDTEVKYFDGHIANIIDGDTDKPTVARIYGTVGVTTQVATTGDTLQVKSSSASDSDGPIVRVEGFIDSARTILGYENITVSTGTPTTYVAGTTTFYEITRVSKSQDTTGYITLADSSDNVLELMGQTDRVMYHKVMKLGAIPDDAYSMRTLFKKKASKMVNNYDYPFTDADDFIILHATGYAYSQEKESVDRAQLMWQKAGEALVKKLASVQRGLGPDYQHKIQATISQAHRG